MTEKSVVGTGHIKIGKKTESVGDRLKQKRSIARRLCS